MSNRPEERVRQALLTKMTQELGYPPPLLALEFYLKESGRRADIVCFSAGEKELKPLLVVECKADRLDEKAARQLVGYNFSLGAPFLSLASTSGVYTFWKEGAIFRFVPFLPRFVELKRAIS